MVHIDEGELKFRGRGEEEGEREREGDGERGRERERERGRVAGAAVLGCGLCNWDRALMYGDSERSNLHLMSVMVAAK
jgi:hypothetical protein